MSLAPGYEVDWNLVRTFVSVVDAGSLAAAARSLNLAHPTVARHIQQLEAQLGVALFERSSGGLALNESGQRLAEVAERMRREAVTLESVGESVRSTTTGRVRVTISELFSELVPELLHPLREQPGASERYLELIVSQEQLNLLDREADIAVRLARPQQGELICRKVGALPMGAWASPEYLAEHGQPELDSLAGHRLIDGLSTRRFAVALERLGHRVPDSQASFRTDSLYSQLRAARQGWGIAGLPNYLAQRSGGLVQVLLDVPEPVSFDIWLVARSTVRQQPLLKMVFDALGNGLAARFGDARSCPSQGVTGSASAPAAVGGGIAMTGNDTSALSA
jgi:DNA-binding transcriptional LysR family regulator